MVRAQILLDDWQYREIKKLASRERTSISGAVRRLLANAMPPGRLEKERLRIVGMLRTPKPAGRDHDRHLYSHPRDV